MHQLEDEAANQPQAELLAQGCRHLLDGANKMIPVLTNELQKLSQSEPWA